MKTSDLGHVLNGISLHIRGTELIEHCKNRAQYHGNRAELYQSKMTEIEALRKSGDEAAHKSVGKGLSNSGDPLDSLERSFKEHQSKSRFFAFSSTHLIEDAVYDTDTADLVTFEIAPGSVRGY